MGFESRVVNSGEIINKGVGITLQATPLKIGGFDWDVQMNFSKNKYELKELAEGVDNIYLGGFVSPQIRADQEHGYGVIWGQGLKYNDNGELVINEYGYPMLEEELGPIGNVQPDWTGGIRNTFSFKGLSLSALIDVRKGGDILNFDQYYMVFYGTAKVTENRNQTKVWEGVHEDGTPNETAIMQDGPYFRDFYSNIDEFFVEDGSFVKLREISLAYSLPTKLMKKIPFSSLSVSVTGRNLWIDSDFTYGDPEGSLYGNGNSQGFYHMVTPSTKGLTFGLKATL
ncbi:hypothetical protein [Xanthovirga aplysinae]|uniref:hypothetical protein n=1 Tax=Xanthovirga aplysinae TaxID=2529853 RepID=UPI0012BC3A88|nr:hypothetical protein [Xanthovirga aplysinae]MTI30395.1 hypothetical protein [Xanthovirga aplysinae]